MTPPQPQTPLSAGLMWASRMTGFGLEVALPALGGYFLDRWLGSSPWATLLGTVLGFGLGFTQLIRIARDASKKS